MQRLTLLKMATQLAVPVNYSLTFNEIKIELNPLIGKKVSIQFMGQIFCIKCGRKTNKSFGQGFCFPCFTTAPETESCVLRPELCQAHLGIARDLEYAQKNCLSEQMVYLAASESIKIGVTRKSQIPVRWIDQGASSAAVIAVAPNRYTAGIIEVELKKYMTDKTNWRAMLTNKIDPLPDFNRYFNLAKEILPEALLQYLLKDIEVIAIQYPVVQYPQKVLSVDLEKVQQIEGILDGIKGQYLIFNDGRVLNIRKHAGYEVEIVVG